MLKEKSEDLLKRITVDPKVMVGKPTIRDPLVFISNLSGRKYGGKIKSCEGLIRNDNQI